MIYLFASSFDGDEVDAADGETWEGNEVGTVEGGGGGGGSRRKSKSSSTSMPRTAK